MQFRRIASEFQPLAMNRPRIAPDRNQTGIHPSWTGAQPTQYSRTAILTAIFTIKSNCDNILRSWGLWWNCRFQAIQPQGPTDCIRIAWIAGQLRQLYATRGDHDQQSVKFAAILPHRLHFHPAPSHIAPTYHKKILPQSCGLWINPWIVGRLQIQCNPHTIQTNCNQMQQIGPGLAQIAAGLEPTQNGAGQDISPKPWQCWHSLLQSWGLWWTRFSGSLRAWHNRGDRGSNANARQLLQDCETKTSGQQS